MTRGMGKSRFIIQWAIRSQVPSLGSEGSLIWYAVHRLNGGWYY
jgi:hypothetical protein